MKAILMGGRLDRLEVEVPEDSSEFKRTHFVYGGPEFNKPRGETMIYRRIKPGGRYFEYEGSVKHLTSVEKSILGSENGIKSGHEHGKTRHAEADRRLSEEIKRAAGLVPGNDGKSPECEHVDVHAMGNGGSEAPRDNTSGTEIHLS